MGCVYSCLHRNTDEVKGVDETTRRFMLKWLLIKTPNTGFHSSSPYELKKRICCTSLCPQLLSEAMSWNNDIPFTSCYILTLGHGIQHLKINFDAWQWVWHSLNCYIPVCGKFRQQYWSKHIRIRSKWVCFYIPGTKTRLRVCLKCTLQAFTEKMHYFCYKRCPNPFAVITR